jgi:hypothetical protein
MVVVVAGKAATGVNERAGRPFAFALAIALALHVPLTPLPWIVRLYAALLGRPDTSAWDYQDDQVIIPISVGEEPPRPSPATAEQKPPGGPGAEAETPRPPKRRHAPSDAGAPDAGSRMADGGARSRDAAADHGDGAAGGVVDAAAGDGGRRTVSDPLAFVGSLSKTVHGKPNVELVMWFSAMRTHPLGAKVGEILSCNPQWRDFIGDTIDPIGDLEGVFLFGPRVVDSSKLTVAVQTRMDQSKVHAVMANLVRQSGRTAGWLDAGAGALAARIHADRADRIVVTHPTNMIYVTPEEGFAQIAAVREPMSLPAGEGRALSLMMVTPWRPFRRIGWNVPETVSEMRLDIVAAEDGGADVTIEFDDQDETLAEQHVHEQNAQLAASPLRFLLGDIKFAAQGSHMVCRDHFSRNTSGFILNMTRGMVCPAPPDAAAPETLRAVPTTGSSRP